MSRVLWLDDLEPIAGTDTPREGGMRLAVPDNGACKVPLNHFRVRSSMHRVALFLLPWIFGACGWIHVNVDQDIPEQYIPGNPVPAAGVLPNFLQMSLNADTNHQAGPLTSAGLRSLTLTATPHGQPSGNFDFLDEVHIYLKSATNSSLPQVEIATLAAVPRGQTTITLTIVPHIDLLPYLKSGAEITSMATGRQPTQDFTFDGRAVITVRI